MTAKELIDVLSKCNPESLVTIWDPTYGYVPVRPDNVKTGLTYNFGYCCFSGDRMQGSEFIGLSWHCIDKTDLKNLSL